MHTKMKHTAPPAHVLQFVVSKFVNSFVDETNIFVEMDR